MAPRCSASRGFAAMSRRARGRMDTKRRCSHFLPRNGGRALCPDFFRYRSSLSGHKVPPTPRSAMKAFLGFTSGLLLAAALFATARAENPLPWGDQGDGTFRNPILPADYSDPDVIRVGDDFYLVASEFHFMGIQVPHSKDLVNWTIISRVFDRLDLDPKYDKMRAYSQGTWAPSLRHHDGLFYLYVCTPRDGLLRWTAKDPAGPWTGSVIKT